MDLMGDVICIMFSVLLQDNVKVLNLFLLRIFIMARWTGIHLCQSLVNGWHRWMCTRTVLKDISSNNQWKTVFKILPHEINHQEPCLLKWNRSPSSFSFPSFTLLLDISGLTLQRMYGTKTCLDLSAQLGRNNCYPSNDKLQNLQPFLTNY